MRSLLIAALLVAVCGGTALAKVVNTEPVTVLTYTIDKPNSLGWNNIHIVAYSGGHPVWCRFGQLVQRTDDFKLPEINPVGEKCDGYSYKVTSVTYGYRTKSDLGQHLNGADRGHSAYHYAFHVDGKDRVYTLFYINVVLQMSPKAGS